MWYVSSSVVDLTACMVIPSESTDPVHSTSGLDWSSPWTQLTALVMTIHAVGLPALEDTIPTGQKSL